MKRTVVVCALGLVALGGLVFRAADLADRPMHPDEANQAVKFGALLETGEYRYDPAEHHGPSLYYLSLPVARLAGRTTLAALDERILRLVPALFGSAAILFLLLFGTAVDRRSLFAAGLLAAVSPVLVFYGRFYIQETLLMAFGVGFLGSLWRAASGRSPGWSAAAGLFAGLMFATKETSVLLFAAAGAALVFAKPRRSPDTVFVEPPRGTRLRQLAAGVAAFAAPAALLYSSFLSHSRGILDSVLSFGRYFEKAGDPGAHSQPLLYYLKSLAFFREGRGPVWTEA
ncbi:MAG: glycosyltransferase family 39 protein, partial [Candidatus Aminicenantes bacterium]|nr:glycosyltransferase family 39 protein [Candidatus Aminicenantes bacterium]